MRFLLILLALSACVPVLIPIPVSAPAGAVRILEDEAATDQGFETLLNGHRAAMGLRPLTQNAGLTQAAMSHASDMVARGYFDHTAPNGAGPTDRAQAAGLPRCGIAENIAAGQKSSAQVFENWLASGPHRRNIENGKMANYGLGHVGDKWVLMLYIPC